MELAPLLAAWNLCSPYQTEPLQSGLINQTWKVTTAEGTFVLQRINTHVFQNPEDVHYNIRLVSDYLREHAPDYRLPAPLPLPHGNDLWVTEEGSYYRLLPYVAGTHTLTEVHTPAQAYEAAYQFGKLTALLSGLEVSRLRITIPHFHDLSFRQRQLQDAISQGNLQRRQKASSVIDAIEAFKYIEKHYRQIKQQPSFRLRVMHHDTKISNVLFDAQEKAVAVIDLDTLMPGYFMSDVGDMMRTYLSPLNEEATQSSEIWVRHDVYTAIREGYLAAMHHELSKEEKNAFFFAGQYMIYMQAIRFLTDYLMDDKYYRVEYPDQNFMRANNQLAFLQCYTAKAAMWA